MKYIFTVTGNTLIVTTDTESGRFKEEVKTYTGASAILANDIIYLSDYGMPKQQFKLHELGTIGGVLYTTLALAFPALLTLITNASLGGSVVAGALAEYNTPTIYDTVGNLPITFPLNTIHEISVLAKTGTTTITVGGEITVLEAGQSLVIPAVGLIDETITINSSTGTFLATTIS